MRAEATAAKQWEADAETERKSRIEALEKRAQAAEVALAKRRGDGAKAMERAAKCRGEMMEAAYNGKADVHDIRALAERGIADIIAILGG